jgi:thiamine-phosphate pyrophosphorylase
MSARRPLPSRLYAIVDAEVAARAHWRVPDLADAYLQAGVRFLQLRAKNAAARDVLAWTEAIAQRAGADSWIIVNDRVDVALAAGTRHVHLGQDDLPVEHARALLGPDAVIGVSTHTSAQIADACRATVDYFAVGPIFGTRTKDTGYAPVGTPLVSEARQHAAAHGALPLVAIGGITLATAASVIEAGADAVVVISDLLVDGAPEARARAFLRTLGEA